MLLTEPDRVRLHADEVEIDASLVCRLIAAQFPRWARLQLAPVPSMGTSHALYRLGTEMVVRLPLVARGVSQVEKEQRWLPRVAPYLPLEVPAVVGLGKPDEAYPFPWSIYSWLAGEDASVAPPRDLAEAASALAGLVNALSGLDLEHGPEPGEHNFGRGAPLAYRDERVREGFAASSDVVDLPEVLAAWDEAMRTPPWDGPPIWIHGDLKTDNLLTVNGRVHAVIDWGGLGVGDPACDMLAAWDPLDAESRERFRRETGVDDATWARGRGWALSVAAMALPYYRDNNPGMFRYALRLVDEVMTDLGRNG